MITTRLFLAICVLDLCTFQVGLCADRFLAPAGPAATAPAAIDARSMAGVVQIARRMSEREWGPAVVETFEKQPAQNPWAGKPGKVRFEGGKLVIEPEAGTGYCFAWRALPAALRGADGLRADLKAAADASGGILNVGLIVSQAGAEVNQWNCHYQFAAGGAGRIQRFQGLQIRGRSVAADPFEPQKFNDITLEIVGRSFTGRRAKADPIEAESENPVTLDEQTIVGLSGMCKQIKVSRLELRPLLPTVKPDELAGLWKATPFANQAALTAYLRAAVVPQLDARDYSKRSAAADLLGALLPLSRPAVVESLKDAQRLSPEMRLQLESLAGLPTPTKIQPIEDRPPADTQPDQPRH